MSAKRAGKKMAAPGDNQNDTDRAARQPASPLMPWLPVSRAPANDNEPELLWGLQAFFGRHVYWLVPTLALAGFSLVLLFLR
ncbi:MAG: hypothetical protein WAW96_12490 [Alphaproteobacteria bacterium]